jgi:Bacterial extracellular solute-binding proteins, family 5 Middle
VPSRSFVALAFVVCLAATMGACASRTPQPGVPSPQPAPPSPEAPRPPPPVTEPPPPPVVPSPPEVASRQCALLGESGEPITTVALSDRVNPANAPRPSNDSERLLFRQLFETLVRVDCEGRVVPALASSWRLSVDGRTWIVTLRPGAHFADGTPVNATGVLAGWSRDGVGGELQPHVNRLVKSLISIDDQTLAITLRSERVDMPLALAHTDLAIARPVAGSPWPIGTRSAQLTADRETLMVTTTTDTVSSVRFLVAPGDPRDLLDKGVDLLLTRDPAALDYAATLPHFQSVPLAWQHTRVLLTRGRTPTSPSLSEEARQALADEAVRGEARGAEGPFWWQMVPDCEAAPLQPRDQSAPASGRIVYDAGDKVARDLAERVVGLASASGSNAATILEALFPNRPRRTSYRATALTGEALALARRRGTDAGYIVSLDRHPLDPCRELQMMTEGARWLDPETVVPLVDTRLRAIVRRGRSGLEAEWDGGLLVRGVNGPR